MSGPVRSKGEGEVPGDAAGSSRNTGDGDDFERLVAPQANGGVRRTDTVGLVLQVMIVFCLLAAVGSLAWIPVTQYIHGRQQSYEAEAARRRFSAWPEGEASSHRRRADEYNRRLAASGQTVLGEAPDPFVKGGGGGSLSGRDRAYRALLDDGHGVMGTIIIPGISVKMPIYHGTADRELAHGAGHLYGTSLPVGGKGTNAVISGHRGLPGSLLFTRLDELRRGDVFYVETLDETMAYRVKSIEVVDPDDIHLYKVVPGRDLVTLMTCTPYGVNTQRLVLTGERWDTNHPAPSTDWGPGDGRLVGGLVALGLSLLGLPLVCLARGKGPVRHRSVRGGPKGA